MSDPLFHQHRMSVQLAHVKFVRRRQAMLTYASISRSTGRPRDVKCLAEAQALVRAGQVLVHEAWLFKSATAEIDAMTACEKTLMLIDKKDLSADMHPLLYEAGNAVSMGRSTYSAAAWPRPVVSCL